MISFYTGEASEKPSPTLASPSLLAFMINNLNMQMLVPLHERKRRGVSICQRILSRILIDKEQNIFDKDTLSDASPVMSGYHSM